MTLTEQLQALAEVIETRLLGIDPGDQDVVLEDDDWRLILDALKERDACKIYLKDDETPAECIQRNRDDADQILRLLARRTAERDALQIARGHYDTALLLAFPDGATGEVFDEWNAAHAALTPTKGQSDAT